MQAICDEVRSANQAVYRVGSQSVVVQTEDAWAATVIERLFAGWYLIPIITTRYESPAIAVRSNASPPQIPPGWQTFAIAGGGSCSTDGKVSYIDIEGSIVAIEASGLTTVEVWINGPLELQSPTLTRVVTYALAAALRRRGLFELHSGAVVEPQSAKGVLIIGPSGSGKSTLTVQLASAGWPFLTDDVLVLSNEGDEIIAWPLRRCFAITSETFNASDFLRGRTSLVYRDAEEDDKKQFAPHEVFGSAFKEKCSPRTLFFSQISGEEQSRVSLLTPSETMARLIRMNPWSCYDRSTAADHLAVLSALVKQSKGFSFLAGKDLLEPDSAARLISRYARGLGK